MSMLKYFFDIEEKESTENIFDGLKIKNEKKIMEHKNQYPVIYISFKSVKFNNFENALKSIEILMSETYKKYDYLLKSHILYPDEREDFNKIVNKKSDYVLLSTAIKKLTEYLCKYHNKKVMVFIDEYDVPIQEGYINGYYDEIMSFERSMLSDLLKDNDNVKKALVTGILRVAKESIFSGLNNLEVDTMLNNKFSDKFGFTQEEVDNLLSYYKDVMIIPKDVSKQGIIIEFKKINEYLDDTIEEATKEALKQMEDKKYEAELLSKGITNIIKLAIVFKNKEVEITQGK